MLASELQASLVYFDREFIANLYEITSGRSSSSQITKTQGKKAGAGLPIFSAEVSAIETRTFSISTLEMLSIVLPIVEAESDLDPSGFVTGMPSRFGWVSAKLGTLTVVPSKGVPNTPTYEKGEEQGCFTLRLGSTRIMLITTPEYFVSGLDALLKMHKVLVRDLEMPVRAYVRVIAAQNHRDEWIAVPYFIHERRDA